MLERLTETDWVNLETGEITEPQTIGEACSVCENPTVAFRDGANWYCERCFDRFEV
jgi:ribosomal protein L37AE/L43A